MRVAVMNNYHVHIHDTPKPRGLRNIVANIENMGNIMFLETITRQLEATAVSAFLDIQRPEYINENFDILVLPLANMISSSWVAHHDLLSALEQLTIPIVVMSVGVQIDTEEQLDTLVMSPAAKRVLDLATNTGTIIGTRGEVTTRALIDRGYMNVKTIGCCPSLYYKPLRIRPLVENPKIAIHLSLGSDREKTGNLLSFGVKHADAYILQNEARFLVNKYSIPKSEYSQWTTDADRLKAFENVDIPYEYYNDGQITPAELRTWIDTHTEFFTDIDEWISYLEDFDLVVGTRYHGTIAALHAGVPSLLYTIDVRTAELAEYHGIPHAPIQRISSHTTIEDVTSLMDYSKFLAIVEQRKAEYVEYLGMHNLSLH